MLICVERRWTSKSDSCPNSQLNSFPNSRLNSFERAFAEVRRTNAFCCFFNFDVETGMTKTLFREQRAMSSKLTFWSKWIERPMACGFGFDYTWVCSSRATLGSSAHCAASSSCLPAKTNCCWLVTMVAERKRESDANMQHSRFACQQRSGAVGRTILYCIFKFGI